MIFEDLRAFVAVAKHGSFSRAAIDLCVAQSALSKRVQRLEHGVGTILLKRGARGVVLSEAGLAFLARVQGVVNEVADMERNLSSVMQTPSGEVRIALTQRNCGVLAPRVIERCRKELPLVNLQVLEGTSANVHAWLLAGKADIALAYNPEFGPEFWTKPCFVEPLYLFTAGAQELAAKLNLRIPKTCSLSDLSTLPLILPKKPSALRVLVERLCTSHGLRPNVIYEADGTYTTRGMVEHGMGVTVSSLSAWNDAVVAGRLIAVPFSSPQVNWKMHIVRARQSISAVAVNRVDEILEQEMGVLLDAGAWSCASRMDK